jgi:hypothetical protein
MILEPPAMRDAPPVSTAVLKSSVVVAEVAGETWERERVITAAYTVTEKLFFIVGSESEPPERHLLNCRG